MAAKKESGSLFQQLRDDLFREAAELVSEVPSTNIAIFITPPPGYESDITACAFGHPSPGAVIKNLFEVEEDEEEEEEVDMSSTMLETMNLEQLNAFRAQIIDLKNQLFLVSEGRSRAEGSSKNPEDEPKP
ncbi:hypothetical protein V5N11_017390 [Cardamine amara subsp. amara]|uniref:Uncharacterized protein n=1 Tax=Cardamine amara subsp. amara TaxID=228776 RepID=A0ABD1B107_CARAN